MSEFPLAANRPRTIPLEEVAAEMGMTVNAVRNCIKQDEDETLVGETEAGRKLIYPPRPDEMRRIPGGRINGASYFVLRQPFERYTGHVSTLQPAEMIRRRA
jgi:hypothetical protein